MSRARECGIARAESGSGPSDEPVDSGDATNADNASLESQFMTILREQTTRRRLEMETRWKQGGLRPRVVHESSSEWIRRVDFQWPLAAMGTASGAVLVSECTDVAGAPEERRDRSRRLVASVKDAHSRDWDTADERGLGERSLLGLYDGGAVTAVAVDARFGDYSPTEGGGGVADDIAENSNSLCALVASGGRDGVLRLWRVPKLAVDEIDLPNKRRTYKSENGAALVPAGRAVHPNVVTSVLLDPVTQTVWTTCLDGKIRRWGMGGVGEKDGEKTDEESDSESQLPLIETLTTNAPALCSSLCPLDRVIYVGTANGDAYVFDAGSTPLTSSETPDKGRVNDSTSPPETLGPLCRWTAHEAGSVRAIAAAAGGCVTGSSTGPIMAWNYRRDDGRRSGTETGTFKDSKRAQRENKPRLVSKLLGHVAAVVGLSTGNPAHLVSGAHDGTVRVWDMPRLSGDGAGTDPGVDLAGVIDDILRGDGGDDGEDAKEKSDDTIDEASENRLSTPPPTERREALYAVTGHTVWLGGVVADETRILCDGANNVAICYDFSEDPDGDGDI